MRYAIIQDGVVVNVVTAESEAFAASQGWVAIPQGVPVTCGWLYVDGQFQPPQEGP